MDPEQVYLQKFASAEFDPLHPGSQVSFVRGFIEGLHKEAGLKPLEILGVLEYMIDIAPIEKTAGIGDFFTDLKNKATGAVAGWQHGDLINGGLKAWDYLKHNVFTMDNLKRIAPYVVGGVGSYLGARALGAGNAGGLAAGAVGAGLGGYGYNHSEELMQKMKDLISQHRAQQQASDLSQAAQPTEAPDQVMKDNSQNAKDILHNLK